MTLTDEMARRALMGAAILLNGELFAAYEGVIPEECTQAAKIIQNNFSEFEQLLWDKLSNLPHTREYFGRLIRTRLKQTSVLASPLISMVFDPMPIIEQRLIRVHNIPGVKRLKKEYRPSEDPNLGRQTDELAMNLLAEILVLDFLVLQSFTNIQKQPDINSEPHIDIKAGKGGKTYAFEVTRKKEITGWRTLPFGSLEDCDSIVNLDKIRELIEKAVSVKDDHFLRAIISGTIDPKCIKVVTIKTSDYGFAECINQAEEISSKLLSSGRWPNVDCIWLIPNVDVGESRWAYR